MNTEVLEKAEKFQVQSQQESELLRKSLIEATETIEYMVNSLMWSAEYKVLAQSKEKLWKLKQVLAHLDA